MRALSGVQTREREVFPQGGAVVFRYDPGSNEFRTTNEPSREAVGRVVCESCGVPHRFTSQSDLRVASGFQHV